MSIGGLTAGDSRSAHELPISVPGHGMKMFDSAWMRQLQLVVVALLVCGLAQAQDASEPPASGWEPVTGAENLRAFMSGRTLILQEGKDSQRRGEYRADGTGTLMAWGGEFERRWEVRGDDQVCVTGVRLSGCYRVERNITDPTWYRVTDVETGEVSELSEADSGEATVVSGSGPADQNRGGAAAPSADELAAQLANPANPIMKIGNNFDFAVFDGDLPDAGDQSAFRYVFLTVFPFKLENGNSVVVRPGIPVMFNEPVPDGLGDYTEEGVDLADTAFDLLYTGTSDTGMIWGYGVAGTLPTATNDRLGKELWGLGPEVMLGVAKKWGVVGGVLSHQWDIGGSGEGSINSTSLNYFYSFPMGGGWQFAAAPAITYNHDAAGGNKLNLPLGIGISKTTVLAGRPWTFQLQYWNHIERPDAFAAEHTIRLSILPVVSAPWNQSK